MVVKLVTPSQSLQDPANGGFISTHTLMIIEAGKGNKVNYSEALLKLLCGGDMHHFLSLFFSQSNPDPKHDRDLFVPCVLKEE